MRYIVLDTNILLSNPYYIKENQSKEITYVIPLVVLRELSNQKSRDNDVSWKARKVLQALAEGTSKFTLEKDLMDIYGDEFLSNDEKIVKAASMIGAEVVTMDKDVKILCDGFNVECDFKLITDVSNTKYDYTGILRLKSGVDDELDAKIATLQGKGKKENIFDMYENQYLILENDNKNGKTQYSYFKCKDNKIQKLYPKKADEKGGMVAQNPEQVCAIDLMFDESIPIKIITGKFGSGKTFIGVNAFTEGMISGKKNSKKLLVLRQAEGDSDSRDIGYLKGTKEEKIQEFFKPITDNICDGNANHYVDDWIRNDRLEFNIPYFMKGRSLKDTNVLVDEAEDLSVKTIRLLGSRIAEDSSIVFCGDYKQTEGRYKTNNGLLHLIDKGKESPLVGYVNLETDIRSEASKFFADM